MTKYVGDHKNLSIQGCLTEAMFELLENHSFAEISISELCKKAGVSRASFYRSFLSKEDVIKAFFKKDLQQWWVDLFTNHESEIDYSFFERLLLHYQDCMKPHLRIIRDRGLIYLLKECIYESGGTLEHMSDYEAYRRSSFLGQAAAIVGLWIVRGMNSTIPPIHHSLHD